MNSPTRDRHDCQKKLRTPATTNPGEAARKQPTWLNGMDVRDETENTVHLSPELVKVLDQRRREWGATSRGEVVEMLLGWMKKKSA